MFCGVPVGSQGRTCTCLCAALKSMLAPMKAPGVSSGCVDRCHWQAQALWQMVLSKTRRGSFPSAKTTFNLPTAMPKGHFSQALAMLRLVSTIQLLAISLRSKPCTVSGSSSAIFQLPSQFPDPAAARSLAFLPAIEGWVARLTRLLSVLRVANGRTCR